MRLEWKANKISIIQKEKSEINLIIDQMSASSWGQNNCLSRWKFKFNDSKHHLVQLNILSLENFIIFDIVLYSKYYMILNSKYFHYYTQ